MQKLVSVVFALAVAICSLGIAPNAAKAAVTWIWDGATLTGAQNVDVNGTLYNVTFADTTCAAAYAPCTDTSDLAFQTEADATAAAQALLDQVFLDTGVNGSPANFDSVPGLTEGCSGAFCQVFVPYAVLPVTFNVSTMLAENEETGGGDDVNPGPVFTKDYNTSSQVSQTYAIFTVVPLPPALLLFLSGLVAFFGIARVGRRRQAAAAAA
jgi:hypothetical protein